MRLRTAILLALLSLLGGRSAAWGQSAPPPPVPTYDLGEPLPPPSPLGKEFAPAQTEVHLHPAGHGGLSDWITYRRPGCDRHGWDPAIQSEVYYRTGVTFPFGGRLFGDILNPGWMNQIGAKSIFLDKSYQRSWFVDMSLANIYADTNDNAPTRPVFVAGQVTTVTRLSRTFVGLGLGREWYLRGSGADPGPNWRVSIDGGGRWGSASARFTDLQYRSDRIGGVYAGLQSAVEMPMQCSPCRFVLGLRTEWSYTWSDILETSSDVQDIGLLLHLGVRF